jgi:hypothetical protein
MIYASAINMKKMIADYGLNVAEGADLAMCMYGMYDTARQYATAQMQGGRTRWRAADRERLFAQFPISQKTITAQEVARANTARTGPVIAPRLESGEEFIHSSDYGTDPGSDQPVRTGALKRPGLRKKPFQSLREAEVPDLPPRPGEEGEVYPSDSDSDIDLSETIGGEEKKRPVGDVFARDESEFSQREVSLSQETDPAPSRIGRSRRSRSRTPDEDIAEESGEESKQETVAPTYIPSTLTSYTPSHNLAPEDDPFALDTEEEVFSARLQLGIPHRTIPPRPAPAPPGPRWPHSLLTGIVEDDGGGGAGGVIAAALILIVLAFVMPRHETPASTGY